MRDVVVTGMGIVCPLGIGKEEVLEALKETRIAIDRITSFDTSDIPVKIAAEVKNFNPNDFIDRKLAKRLDRFVQFALVATKEALQESGLDLSKLDKDRIVVIIGSGMGGYLTLESEEKVMAEKGPSRVSPFMVPKLLINMAAGVVAMEYGITGANFAPVSACATSLHSVILGTLLIRHGYADVAIVGGSEATIAKLPVVGFANMRALSTRNDDPKGASRPFDKARDGFVMGEGSAILILESEDLAVERSARILAKIKGIGMNDDAYHFSAPHPEGEGAYKCMKMALEDSGLKPEDIDYISCHATSTPAGDEAEVKAIKRLLGPHSENVKINASKTLMGHLLGAAGAAELVMAILQMNNDFVHGMPNLEDPDDELEGLGYPGKEAESWKIRNFIKNAFGFGGHNASVVVGRYES